MLLSFLFSMSGSLPFEVETKDDEDEDEKIAEAVKKGKWSFDNKAFARSTSEVKDFISALMSKDAKYVPRLKHKSVSQSISQSVNRFIDVNTWDKVVLHIQAWGSCIKLMTNSLEVIPQKLMLSVDFF